MKRNLRTVVSMLTVALVSLAVLMGCETGTDAAAPSAADPVAVTGVDFEGTQIADLQAAGGLTPVTGDVVATWGGTDAAVSDMAFAADTTVFNAGATSLKVTATALQNKYSTSVGQWYFDFDLGKVSGVTVPIDLTGKKVSLKFYVPAAGKLTAAKLVFIDDTGKASQGKEAPLTAVDTWDTASYLFGDPTDYTVPGFDIAKVAAIRIVGISNTITANASGQIMYFDDLAW